MNDSTLHDSYDEDTLLPRSPQLKAFKPDLGPEKELEPASSGVVAKPRRKRKKGAERYPRLDPGSAAVGRELSRTDPSILHFDLDGYEASSESELEDNAGMPELGAKPQEAGIGGPPAFNKDVSASTKTEPVEPSSPKEDKASAIANAALQQHATTEAGDNASESLLVQRHDSGHSEAFPSAEEKNFRTARTPELRVDTKHSNNQSKQSDDTMADSPTLRKHMAEEAAGTLPAIDGQAASPKLEKLPSVRQITMGGEALNELAEAATKQDPRSQPLGHQHSQSFGSAASPPAIPFHPHTAAQTSPSSHYAMSARSPASAMSDPYYGSPPLHSSSAYFVARRSSAAANTPNFPSLPSAASSNESQGPATSSADGYTPSTSHTTPNDQGQVPDGTPGHTIQPTPSATQITHGYRCEHPGCTASPFQTQYLLSSHRNVHSQRRDHFCSIAGCPRAEGGRGFKRKNEMKRHALVHQSPGYTCPFCPDKEHKYPRPDNLQRHVRVHHVDKSKDDPRLRDVLAARNDGNGKVARRRRNTAS